jgi:hypothetical protein
MEKLTIVKVVLANTKNGDPFRIVDVRKQDGTIVPKVSAFKFKFPNLESLVDGAEIEGAVVVDGQYKNLVASIEKKGNSNFKTAQIEKVMETKRQDISKFQDNKELSIKVASTLRMAVDVATSLTSEQMQTTTMQEEITWWREWFWLEWDRTGEIKPF